MTDFIQHIVEDFNFSLVDNNSYDNVIFNHITITLSKLLGIDMKIDNVDENLGFSMVPVNPGEYVNILCSFQPDGNMEPCDPELLKFIKQYQIYFVKNSVLIINESYKKINCVHTPDFIDCIGYKAFKGFDINDLYLGKYTTTIRPYAFTDATIGNLHLGENIDVFRIHSCAFGLMNSDFENIFYKNPETKQQFEQLNVKKQFLNALKPEEKID